jgi:hypothetical protein
LIVHANFSRSTYTNDALAEAELLISLTGAELLWFTPSRYAPTTCRYVLEPSRYAPEATCALGSRSVMIIQQAAKIYQ